jgi:hypothetical protein
LLMTMETRVMKSELLITKWVAITQGGIIWKKHTCAATGSYPWSMGHHKMRSEWMYPNYTQCQQRTSKAQF